MSEDSLERGDNDAGNDSSYDSENDLREGEESVKRVKKGRRKRDIKYIEEKSKRQISFSKRKAGLIKKAYQLSVLTNAELLLLISSETGHIYTFASPKLKPMVDEEGGKERIQNYLNTTQGKKEKN